MTDNIILKSIGGFYYVKSGDKIIECKAKGKFRNLSLSPLAGDIVDFEDDGSTKIISKIYPRKNKFVRPPFANLDLMILVVSTVEPAPNFLVLDKMCAIARHKDVDVAVVITKTDMAEYNHVHDIYTKVGYPVFFTGENDQEQLSKLRELMKGKLCAFSGNSGVGKSTLLNKLFPHLELETGRISKKLGRGKHTTRQVEIFPMEDCMVADTPGFSSVELDYDNFISKDDLQHAFIEFSQYTDDCKFRDCSHTGEKGCAIKDAVDRGDIALSRYESYKTLYERQKEIKDWEL